MDSRHSQRHTGVAAAVLGLAAMSIGAAAPAAQGAAALFNQHCMACHGLNGEGIEGLGVGLVSSAFVDQSSTSELTEFLKAGRLPNDPQTVSGRPMPGFAYLADADLVAISDYLKELHGSR